MCGGDTLGMGDSDKYRIQIWMSEEEDQILFDQVFEREFLLSLTRSLGKVHFRYKLFCLLFPAMIGNTILW